jgi:hypothetical protein
MSSALGEGNVSEPLFVTQRKLEAWIESGEVTFDDDVLTLKAEQKSYRLRAALKVSGVIDGVDKLGLVGRVMSTVELTQQGGEYLQGSAIVGDTAYQCEDGFVGDEQVKAAADKQASDADLLVEFLLKHL